MVPSFAFEKLTVFGKSQQMRPAFSTLNPAVCDLTISLAFPEHLRSYMFPKGGRGHLPLQP